jgi:hypothetical protein
MEQIRTRAVSRNNLKISSNCLRWRSIARTLLALYGWPSRENVGTGAGRCAKVLAEEIVKPGIEAVAMFRIVQRRVSAAIRQEPYLGFSAVGDVYVAGNTEQLPPAPTAQGRDLADEPKKTRFEVPINPRTVFAAGIDESAWQGQGRHASVLDAFSCCLVPLKKPITRWMRQPNAPLLAPGERCCYWVNSRLS